MQNEAMKLYQEMTEKTVESVKRLSELNLRTFETLAAKQIEIMQSCMDAGVKQSELLTDVRDVNDMVSAQTELATSCADKFSANMTETADIMKTAQTELTGLVEEAVSDAKENAKKVTEMSKKGVETATKAAKTTKKAA